MLVRLDTSRLVFLVAGYSCVFGVLVKYRQGTFSNGMMLHTDH